MAKVTPVFPGPAKLAQLGAGTAQFCLWYNLNPFLTQLQERILSVLHTFQTTPWRLISWILGVLCLLLMITLGILLHKSFSEQSVPPTVSPGSTEELQKDIDCCSCPEKWIGYRCNCYRKFNEGKTWTESRNSCASQNSTLLYLESEDELQDFWKHGQIFYWVGLSYNKSNGTWLWEDGSALSRNLFPSFQNLNPEKCISFNPRGDTLSETCKMKNHYICKKWPM
ncbi:PREDICTED: natural killer cells antigen CD94-like [Chrysochloris asiatica]|uniref:Natural killer cells antigen CD94 n=1 Tax=Chrysochloris asiatica TaxID=185453 RepID=A0A9B0U431_CHRAS|nr:PREDICTED: natural killer cells antigen CD94-like [Chrysochloris asiatica]